MEVKPRGTFLRSGKVKDIYELDANRLLFYFTDRVSAFDVILPSTIPRKGEVLCKLSAFWFETLGVPNHMVSVEGSNIMVVNRMTMIPVECVVRGYLYGSLHDRLLKGEVSLPTEKVLAAKLPEPYFDPTTKSEVKDEPITEAEIVREGRMTSAEMRGVKDSTLSIYAKMGERAIEHGFILADLKLEFGRRDGRVLLGDSIGPDEFRMWPADRYAPGKTQDSYDKQPVRDWLTKAGYKEKLDRARKSGEPTPTPPLLPAELVSLVSDRYVHIYEVLTGRKL
ncbi:MAG: phosphoribosylaminoimidazolesuccinocarboxamide synthase [Thaumarchaeota archaeon]|nr:phosphoribosylaminoimidazolesuccinocarboxamide synthase [Nitrososphaerota archaeon]